ncbi:MAG: chromosomal replication initiator protein DnaA [Synergistaceae bacterium]|nr:chromosomal replication initiator protein DnaA [Synergistaceae bacterium]
MDNSSVVWQEFLKFLQADSSNDRLLIYVSNCLPKSFEDRILVLEAPNAFSYEQIKKNFLNILNNLFIQSAFGDEIKLELDSSNQEAIRVTNNTKKEIKNEKIPFTRFGLNPYYTFGTFIEGPTNDLAKSVCLAVARNPGFSYNPLFLYGNSGLGKTHLMQAVGNYVIEQNPDAKVLYEASETFTNSFTIAIKEDKIKDLISKYRTLDILMIDDVQFFSGKERTMEYFFNIFNELTNANKQIILTADQQPKDIIGFNERLVSRFMSGMVADITPPDFETRVAILMKKAEVRNYHNIPDEIFTLIAHNIKKNIRELEGALNRLVACSDISGEEINIENTNKWLKDFFISSDNSIITIEKIQLAVANSFKISVEDMLSPNRSSEIALPRHVAMYLARNKTNQSLIQIAHAFNKKDHTSVMHGCERIENELRIDKSLASVVENIVKNL